MIRLRLAQWIVALSAEPSLVAELLAARFADFADASDRAPDLTIHLDIQAGTDDGPGVLQAPLTAKGEDYLLDGPQFYGIIGPFRGQAALSMRSEVPTREAEYFLRVALALFAWSRGGLLVHGAAIKAGSGTFLFVGQSGSGKSTVVSLSRAAGKVTALSDDLVLLCPGGDSWQAYGTPFWNVETVGREGQTASGTVRSIYKLAKSRDVFVEPMSTAAAAAELLANCPIVNSQPALVPELLERCRDIVKAVGMQRLHFRKDDAFWNIISC